MVTTRRGGVELRTGSHWVDMQKLQRLNCEVRSSFTHDDLTFGSQWIRVQPLRQVGLTFRLTLVKFVSAEDWSEMRNALNHYLTSYLTVHLIQK